MRARLYQTEGSNVLYSSPRCRPFDGASKGSRMFQSNKILARGSFLSHLFQDPGGTLLKKTTSNVTRLALVMRSRSAMRSMNDGFINAGDRNTAGTGQPSKIRVVFEDVNVRSAEIPIRHLNRPTHCQRVLFANHEPSALRRKRTGNWRRENQR